MNDLVLLIKSMVLISLPNFQLGESCWNACLSSMLSIQGITCHTNPSLISIWVPKYKWGCNEYTDKKLVRIDIFLLLHYSDDADMIYHTFVRKYTFRDITKTPFTLKTSLFIRVPTFYLLITIHLYVLKGIKPT